MNTDQKNADTLSASVSNVTASDCFLSVVTPAYREAASLPELYARLKTVLDELGVRWEWVIVDDHSQDGTFAVIQEMARSDPRIRGIRLARNTGSHMALTCALQAARGDCAVALAADCQDPPETIPALFEQWQAGIQVVWAARGKREGESATTVAMARAYYWLMRNLVGFTEMSETGADFFLLDRRVLDAFCDFRETNVSILALITWMGFRQTTLTYTKEARRQGESSWTLTKKLKLLVDSITAFSYHPIRFMSYAGFIVALSGFAYALIVLINAIAGDPPQGWTTLIVIVLVLGGMQMLMMGVLGEYLWRALDEARRRPQFIVEATTFEVSERLQKDSQA
jgi:glycosyltransferase involved in cell wall biosynthesis